MRRKGFRTRLERVERREQAGARFRAIRFIATMHGADPDAIIGYSGPGKGITIMRAAGEPLAALQDRAWELVGNMTLVALYSAADIHQSGIPSQAERLV
jgi:hypothetical protein